MPEYQAVRDHHRTGENEVLFDGVPIDHQPYDTTATEDFEWGYNGGGPTTTARSILEHAVREVDEDFDTTPREAMIDFRKKFIASWATDGECSLTLSEVVNFLRQY